VIRFRSYRNSDSPALVKLWNQVVPEGHAARPLSVHELDSHAFNSACFDRDGLIVAERDQRIVGYVHSGFGPDQPIESTQPFELDRSMGTIALLVVEPGLEHSELPRGLILEAERYLRLRGANVLYAGGQLPINPFYWGLYGGSEGSGVLSSHPGFPQALSDLEYQPASVTVFLEFKLSDPDPRDPRAVLIRRRTKLDLEEDANPVNWWENQALGELHLARFRLLARSDGSELARATTWDMSGFGRGDALSRIGMIGVEVALPHRRKGYGRYLVSEVLRWARDHAVDLVEVQTASTNVPALSLYDSLGFQAIEQSTLYRLPAHLLDRSGRA
jgi:ribosomal protein S18 acetylase RimI-like enzyme